MTTVAAVEENVYCVGVEGTSDDLDVPMEERITSTLGSRGHTMSGLHDLRCGRHGEVSDIFACFRTLGSAFGIALPTTSACVALYELRRVTAADARAVAAASAASLKASPSSPDIGELRRLCY